MQYDFTAQDSDDVIPYRAAVRSSIWSDEKQANGSECSTSPNQNLFHGPDSDDDGSYPYEGDYVSPDRFMTDFDNFSELGCGDFGRVTAATSIADGQRYAIKVSHKEITGAVDLQHRLQEAYALASVRCCDHVVRFHDAWTDDEKLFIATELLSGGSVRSLSGEPWPEHALWDLALQAALGLHAVHSANVAHLDIKPDNLLCQRNDDGSLTYKIGDFGLARPLYADMAQKYLGLNDDEGDARYLCPELLANADTPFLREADVYALGMTLADLAGVDPRQLRHSQDYSRLAASYSHDFVLLIEALTHYTPSARPSAFDVVVTASRWMNRAESPAAGMTAHEQEAFDAKMADVEALRAELAALSADS